MAAILCEAVGKMTNALFVGMEKVCSVPLLLFGTTVEGILQSDAPCNLMRTPYFLYATVAIGFNIPPIFFSVMSYFIKDDFYNYPNECDNRVIPWLRVNGPLSLINIVAALYIRKQIMKKNETPLNTPENYTATEQDGSLPESSKTDPSSLESDQDQETLKRAERTRQVLCYDPLVAIYILIGIFFVFWQSHGLSRLASDEDDDGAVCSENVRDDAENSIICGYLFVLLGGCAFACSRSSQRLFQLPQ